MPEEVKAEIRQRLLESGVPEEEIEFVLAEMENGEGNVSVDDDNSDDSNDTPSDVSGTMLAEPIVYDIVDLRKKGYTDAEIMDMGYTQEYIDAADRYMNGEPINATPEPISSEELEKKKKYEETYNYYLSIGYTKEEAEDSAYIAVYVPEEERKQYNPFDDPEYMSQVTSGDAGTVNLGEEISAILKETPNPLGNNNVGGMSRLDYLAIYASSGNYNRTQLDAKMSMISATELNLAPHPSHYFVGTQFEEMYNSLSTANDFRQKANSLTEEVKLLKKEYASAHQAYESWKGTASQLELETMENIMKKFDSAISDLEKALKPACDGLNKLKSQLEKLRDGEKKLFQLTGVDGDGSPLATQAKDCLYLLKKQQEELQEAYNASSSSYNNLSNNPEYDDNNKTTSSYNKNLNNAKSKMNADKAKLDKINKDIENKEKQIEKAKTDLDKILEQVILTIFDINSYDSNLESFESYLGFDPGDKGQPHEHYTDWDTFKTHTMYNYRDIMMDNSYEHRRYNNDSSSNNDDNKDEKADIYSEFEDMFSG